MGSGLLLSPAPLLGRHEDAESSARSPAARAHAALCLGLTE